MLHQIRNIDLKEFLKVVMLWGSSVKATYKFLKEEYILYFKPLILNQYLRAITLKKARDPYNKIIGFLGISDDTIEMLFITPKYFGQGIGATL